MPGTDILIVSAANTTGWQVAAEELAGSIARAGAAVEVVTAEPAPRVRTFMLTDFVQARTARVAAQRGLDRYKPRSVLYCSITAALLWPRPGAISLDSIAAENRPGRHGVWQRQVERRRLAEAPLILAWSEHALDPLVGRRPETVVVPVPVERPETAALERDLAAVTYAGDPVKRRLPLVLDAWARTRHGDETLIVTGTDEVPETEGVQSTGKISPEDFRRLLLRARVFVAAPRREDYGVAALEALACGCMLVTTPSPGPYPALDIARALDPRLVSDDLPAAIRIALDDPLPGYAERAAEELEPFSRASMDKAVAERVLPRLLS
ncbi:MAG TPA: glycosyltransferase [Solirubrobacteraceae bacterium]|nr:glycosyltransferase [Solirubrobacteraceae bacterium]